MQIQVAQCHPGKVSPFVRTRRCRSGRPGTKGGGAAARERSWAQERWPSQVRECSSRGSCLGGPGPPGEERRGIKQTVLGLPHPCFRPNLFPSWLPVAPDAVEKFHKSEREVQAQEEKQVPGGLVRQDGPGYDTVGEEPGE